MKNIKKALSILDGHMFKLGVDPKEREVVKAARDELYEVGDLLKSIEWCCDDGQQCPVCGGTWVQDKGHSPDCKLAKFIQQY